MASQPPQQPGPPPDSITLSAFDGLKNTVASERLGQRDLDRAINIDLDDSGQPRRRRGFALMSAGDWHSIVGPLAGKCYGVFNSMLGIIRPDASFFSLDVVIGDVPVCYDVVDQQVYFSSANMSGVITINETVQPWGETDGQGFWDSPVNAPTPTLGEVGGKLLGDPPRATDIAAFHGRIYLASGKTLWRTELYRYHYVDRTKNFYQFEYDITLVIAVDDGLYVGTTGGLYFLQEERVIMREFGSLQLQRVIDSPVLRGSGVVVPVELVHPNAASQPTATGTAIVFYTSDGIMAGFNAGETYNLTWERVVLPSGLSAAGLFRQDMGDNQYVAVVDSGGTPAINARIGDYLDAQIIRNGVIVS